VCHLLLFLFYSTLVDCTFYKGYVKTEDFYERMDELQRLYPDIVTVEDIGRSAENRTIKAIRVSADSNYQRTIMTVSLLHAREWITGPSNLYAIEQLCEQYQSGVPGVVELLSFFQFNSIVVANPDGYDYTHLSKQTRYWRKNRRKAPGCSGGRRLGVDLNRNFGIDWGKGSASPFCSSDIFRGPDAFSEPESKVLRDFLLSITPLPIAFIDFHAFGQVVVVPPGGSETKLPYQAELLDFASFTAASLSKLSKNVPPYESGVVGDFFNLAGGGTDDWAHRGAGVPYSATVELTPDSFNHPEEGIITIARTVSLMLVDLGGWLRARVEGSALEGGECVMQSTGKSVHPNVCVGPPTKSPTTSSPTTSPTTTSPTTTSPTTSSTTSSPTTSPTTTSPTTTSTTTSPTTT